MSGHRISADKQGDMNQSGTMSEKPCGPAIERISSPHDKAIVKLHSNPRCVKVLTLARVLESIVYGVVLMNLWGQ